MILGYATLDDRGRLPLKKWLTGARFVRVQSTDNPGELLLVQVDEDAR